MKLEELIQQQYLPTQPNFSTSGLPNIDKSTGFNEWTQFQIQQDMYPGQSAATCNNTPSSIPRSTISNQCPTSQTARMPPKLPTHEDMNLLIQSLLDNCRRKSNNSNPIPMLHNGANEIDNHHTWCPDDIHVCKSPQMHQRYNINYESNKITDSVMNISASNLEGNLPDCHGTAAVKIFSPSTNLQLSQSTHGSRGKKQRSTQMVEKAQSDNICDSNNPRPSRFPTHEEMKDLVQKLLDDCRGSKKQDTRKHPLCPGITCHMATEDLNQCLLRNILNVSIETGISSCPPEDIVMGLKCSTP